LSKNKRKRAVGRVAQRCKARKIKTAPAKTNPTKLLFTNSISEIYTCKNIKSIYILKKDV